MCSKLDSFKEFVLRGHKLISEGQADKALSLAFCLLDSLGNVAFREQEPKRACVSKSVQPSNSKRINQIQRKR